MRHGRSRSLMSATAIVVALLLGCRSEERALEIAITTSVDATGLLQAKATEFQRSTGMRTLPPAISAAANARLRMPGSASHHFSKSTFAA